LLLLGIDFETTMCSSENNYDGTFIIEVGAALYDWDTKAPVEILSTLIKPYDDRMKVAPFITDLTGISMNMLNKHGSSIKPVLKKLITMAKKADYLVAHNGRDFDKKILLNECERAGLKFPEIPLIDTLKDIDYPNTCKYKNLTYLAGYHQIMGGGHRAIFDVFTMMKVLSLYNLDKAINNTSRIKIKLIARLTGEEARDAKKIGFRYDPSVGGWVKKIKKFELEELKKSINFEYEIRE
jgi:DNA polymerase-3 subunit epsilon